MDFINRTEYLDWLVRHKDEHIIKVVSGVRRCGKSTLFAIFQDFLRTHGVPDRNIIHLNFESIDYEDLLDYRALYRHISEQLIPDRKNYIFLDEIQHVDQYQKAVDSLFLNENCDLYLTGSNAYFMSGELATRLTGRYMDLSMMPLSFKEFCEGLKEDRQMLSVQEKFQLYLGIGSFPYVLRYQYGLMDARDYMRSIYESILLNDIVKRYNIADVNMLEAVTKFVMHNIGNRTSATTIANTMTSNHRKIDAKTVDRYLRGLTESLLFYEARRYNIKGKEFLATMNKYYIADIGMRNMLVRGTESDSGHILENIVYLELKRRGFDVSVGQLGPDGEVDFVAMKDGQPEYYQVAGTTLDESVLRRELKPLQKIRDNYPKYLLTLDTLFGAMNYEGIQKINVLDWLLGQSGLLMK